MTHTQTAIIVGGGIAGPVPDPSVRPIKHVIWRADLY
jgi:hypothetical protein